MTELLRARVKLEWALGGPGVNTYYISAGLPSPLDWVNTADQAHTELAEVYRSLNSFICGAVTWTVERDFDVIDVETGNIVDQIVLDSEQQSGVGANTGIDVTRAQQIYIRFQTARWENGKRLAGGVFIGPTGSTGIHADGGYAPATRETMRDAFAAITSGVGPRLAVYHRPPRGASSGGYYGDVVNVRPKDRPGILRSRRD